MSNSTGVPVKVAGALSGVVYVESAASTVRELRENVARLLGKAVQLSASQQALPATTERHEAPTGVADASAIKMIARGRTLQLQVWKGAAAIQYVINNDINVANRNRA